MSKKAIVLALILSLLVSVLAGTLIINRVFAQIGYVGTVNVGPNYDPLLVNLTYPTENQVYKNSTIIQLDFTVTKPAVWFNWNFYELWDLYYCQGNVTFIRYSIDGKPNVTIPANDKHTGLSYNPIPNTLNYSLTMQGLSQGLHTLSVSAEGTYNYWSDSGTEYSNVVVGNSSQIIFYINNFVPPEILNLSKSNETYHVTYVPLNFTVNEPTSWIGYSLDGKANLTIGGNTTLTGLTYGLHNLTIYANVTFGNTGSSETISFSIATPDAEHFPTVNVIAVSAALSLVAAFAGLIYFKKRKPRA
jgi:hypothetical protein